MKNYDQECETQCPKCIHSNECIFNTATHGVAETIIQKGKKVTTQNNDKSSIVFIKSGSVKTVSYDIENYEQVIGFNFPGELIISKGNKLNRTAIVALETTAACSMELSIFNEFIGKDSVARSRFLSEVERISLRYQRFMMLMNKKSDDKLSAFIEGMIPDADDNEKKILHTIKIPKYDIASYLGLAPETVSRSFSRIYGANKETQAFV